MFAGIGMVLGIAIGIFWVSYANAKDLDDLVLIGGWFLCVFGFTAFGSFIDSGVKQSKTNSDQKINLPNNSSFWIIIVAQNIYF